MADTVLLYISAALDLDLERDVINRAVAEIPVTLGWRIVQTPVHGEPVDLSSAAQADFHLLLLGSDIRAPVGMEWVAARRAGRNPALLIKQGALRTPAGESFRRHLERDGTWLPFKDNPDLKRQVLLLLSGHLIEEAVYYKLFPEEYEKLVAWRKELERSTEEMAEDTRGGAGDSGVILSRERFVPKDGVLLRPGDDRSTN